MSTPGHDFGAWSPKLCGLLSVIVGIIVIVAILCWPGGFSVVAQGHGSSIEAQVHREPSGPGRCSIACCRRVVETIRRRDGVS